MKREFISTAIFLKRWNELGFNDDDLRKLENFMLENLFAGDVIVGTGGLKKLRWALPDTGKSGGVRILTVDFASYKTIILINCYGKREKDTISDQEKAMYKALIKEIEKSLRGRS